ncbi:hypothetical protein [Desulfosarcina sp. BuS5]|uniref:hypothetical protein n=1 Tax=Desulfosarcina sp. BuS5 TaxID=933262 RepID=UPI0012F8D945|nr:hypothetical protein [Desulfosarcina sp. BuS5]
MPSPKPYREFRGHHTYFFGFHPGFLGFSVTPNDFSNFSINGIFGRLADRFSHVFAIDSVFLL